MTREEQDKRWYELSQADRQSRIASYRELQELQKDGKDSYLIVIKDLEMLYGSHNLQPKPKLTYEDVRKRLFRGRVSYHTKMEYISNEHLSKMVAINKLLNVAHYLHKNEDGTDWVPDWEKITEYEEEIFGIGIDCIFDEVRVFPVNPDRISTEIVYFRTKEIAQQAIEILGEETIRTALGNY